MIGDNADENIEFNNKLKIYKLFNVPAPGIRNPNYQKQTE